MTWNEESLAALPIENGFRLRGSGGSTRLEAFCDSAYAFAVTLLVVAGGVVPTSFAALLAALRDVPAFLASFVSILLIWLAYRQWSRRYGLEDGWTSMASLGMVFVMLVYVYPLRMVASAFMAFLSGGRLPSTFVLSSIGDLTGLFVVYGLGFALQTTLLAALYRRAQRFAAELKLDAAERVLTRHGVVSHATMAATGLASALAAGLLPPRFGVWAGFIYMTLGISMPMLSARYRRSAERVARETSR